MYLSRIELDTHRRETMRALGSPYVFHAAIENCYTSIAETESSRKLWRIDRLGERFYLLLLSPEKPDFSGFAAQFCSSGVQGESKPYDRLLSRVQSGQRWQFRLCANPVHSVKKEAGASDRGRVYAHITVEQQKRWLRQKAKQCGFYLESENAEEGKCSFDVIQSETVRFNRQHKSVTLGVVTFEGVLFVTNAALFAKSLTEGIGRAKAFGCGLLTIAGIS